MSLFLTASNLTGCGGSDSPGAGAKGNVPLTDSSNYTGQASLTIPTVETAPGADLTICWDKLTKDLLCHSLDPITGIDNASFAKIPKTTPDQVAAQLAVGQLDPNQAVYFEHHVEHGKTPPETCTMLSALKFGASLVPSTGYVEDPNSTYMLLFETGINPAINVKSMTFIKPVASSTNTMVSAPDACSNKVLHFTAKLGQPVSIPKAGPWVLDWSQITKDAFGNPVKLKTIDKVEVGYYQGKTAAEIEAAFVDVEVSATSLYQAKVPGGDRTLDIAKTTDVTDATMAFPGFDRTDGVWLVAVLSSTSQTPAPIVLSILQPQ